MKMREILFRGKRADNGEWVEGDYQLSSLQTFIIERGTQKRYKVKPETVGQFTGLTDSNGTKVFEGDVLNLTDTNLNYGWLGEVIFGNPNGEYNWGFQLRYIGGTKPNTDILLWLDMDDMGSYSEVIGNIHDNAKSKGVNNDTYN